MLAFIDGSIYSDSVCDHVIWAAAEENFEVSLFNVIEGVYSAEAPSNFSGNLGAEAKSKLLIELSELDQKRSKLAQKKARLVLDLAKEKLVEGGIKPKHIELDVLVEDTAAEHYWPRNEKFDTVLDITFPRPGLDALCRNLELWIEHLLNTDVRIQPVQEINDERWVWHVGLDAEASALLNDLYAGKNVGADRLKNLLSLILSL